MDNFKFSQKGDQGETSLLSGERVSKASLRPETYGTLDEASSALGLAKALSENEKIRRMIDTLQDDLIVLGAELAWEKKEKNPHRIEADRTVRLEKWIDELQEEVSIPHRFIHPGANRVSAALDFSRAVIRRAERKAVSLRDAGLLDHGEVHSYLNRLADCLFVLARYAEKRG